MPRMATQRPLLVLIIQLCIVLRVTDSFTSSRIRQHRPLRQQQHSQWSSSALFQVEPPRNGVNGHARDPTTDDSLNDLKDKGASPAVGTFSQTPVSPATAAAATTDADEQPTLTLTTPLHVPHHSPEQVQGTTLGDIMGTGLQTLSFSTQRDQRTTTTTTTTVTTTLAAQYNISNPLDRMALTANGNLQRLISSYYDAPVNVKVESCVLRRNNGSDLLGATTTAQQTSPKTWDRIVHLQVFGKTFCTAVSTITVHDQQCQVLVESNQVGLGQLFRYLDLLPEFTLHKAGLLIDGGFWREYSLQCDELTCEIREDFGPGLWEMAPPYSVGIIINEE